MKEDVLDTTSINRNHARVTEMRSAIPEDANSVTTDNLTSDKIKKDKRIIIINAAILFTSNSLISFGRMFFLNSTSSLIYNNETTSLILSLHTFAQLLGALLFLTPVQSLMSLNVTIVIGLICSSVWCVSFFYPITPILATGGFFSGFGLSIIIGSSFTYVNILAYWYHLLTKKEVRKYLIIMSSAIYATILGGFFTGNLLFSSIFYTTVNYSSNFTVNTLCGANFCGEHLKPNYLIDLSQWKFLVVLIIFNAASVLGIIISFFLKNISDKSPTEDNAKKETSCNVMKDLFYLAKDTPSLLLAFTSIMIGTQQAYMMSDFPRAYITCYIGSSRIGFIMMGFGLSQIIMPFIYWLIIKLLGTFGTFSAVFLETLVFYFLLLFLPSEYYNEKLLFLMTVMSGISGSLFMSLSTSSYALLYPKYLKRTQFLANFWRSIGLMIGYNVDRLLCIKANLYFQTGITVIAGGCYIILELIIYQKGKKKTKNDVK